VPFVETQAKKIVQIIPSRSVQFSSALRIVDRNNHALPRPLTTISQRKYCTNMTQPPKRPGKLDGWKQHLKESTTGSLRKLYVPMGAPLAQRVLSGLNRFGPLQAINPFFMWNLQTAYRPYVTMSVSLLSTLLYLTSVVGTTDSTMRLVAVPARFWSGDEARLLSSPFVHTHAFHLLSLSGFLLAFGTAVEVAAGPLALITVLLSCAVVGCAAAICAPERSAKYVTILFPIFFALLIVLDMLLIHIPQKSKIKKKKCSPFAS
jgi:membrane associated rhomboid family serine protease